MNATSFAEQIELEIEAIISLLTPREDLLNEIPLGKNSLPSFTDQDSIISTFDRVVE
jgi:hypothetical protein